MSSANGVKYDILLSTVAPLADPTLTMNEVYAGVPPPGVNPQATLPLYLAGLRVGIEVCIREAGWIPAFANGSEQSFSNQAVWSAESPYLRMNTAPLCLKLFCLLDSTVFTLFVCQQ